MHIVSVYSTLHVRQRISFVSFRKKLEGSAVFRAESANFGEKMDYRKFGK